MVYAVIAIFIMFIANYLITFSRTRLSGIKRKTTSIIAYLLLLPAFLFILKALI